ncbi:MAG TPA: efflux RND transporter periplasmic adaptor subunit [Methylocystis sp.]|nr:efflux RND transporter periplasmic adaptor subunit [Methylocystis sp.]
MGPIARFFGSKRGYAFIALMAALALAWYASGWLTAGPAPKYVTAKVVRGDIESTALATGLVQPIRQVDVGTRVTGQLKSLRAKLGDHVRAGDLLAEIDPLVPENELKAAQAELANLEAQKASAIAKLKRAKLELERQRGLIKGAATSRRDLEAAEAEQLADTASLNALDAQIAQARSKVGVAAANLSYTKITAPIEGEVVGVLTQEGQTVVAAQIVPVILRLAQMDSVTIKTLVSEADVLNVKVGQPAYFTVMGEPGKRFSSVLRTVDLAPQSYSEPASASGGLSASASTGNAAVFYNAFLDVANADRQLRIGMTAQVSIVTGVSKDVLLVPSTALRGEAPDGRQGVRVLGPGGKVERREVRVGVNNHTLAEALDGLKEGEEVITGEVASPQESRS